MTHKAVLVGLNHYPDPRNNLKGCVNDVLMMSNLLQQRGGFPDADNIRLLADERATTARIKSRLTWLVDGAKRGDVLVFHYSGHGAQVRDRNGDELKDHADETICPYDFDWDNPFTDDDLGKLLSGAPRGVNLTVILDSCHSGTGLKEFIGPNPATRPKFLVPPPDIQHRMGPAIRDLGFDRSVTMTEPTRPLKVRRFGQHAQERGAILIAGCRADQTSMDMPIDGDNHGALTYGLWSAVSSRPQITYQQAISAVRRFMVQHRLTQVPQLEGPESLLSGNMFSAAKASKKSAPGKATASPKAGAGKRRTVAASKASRRK